MSSSKTSGRSIGIRSVSGSGSWLRPISCLAYNRVTRNGPQRAAPCDRLVRALAMRSATALRTLAPSTDRYSAVPSSSAPTYAVRSARSSTRSSVSRSIGSSPPERTAASNGSISARVRVPSRRRQAGPSARPAEPARASRNSTSSPRSRASSSASMTMTGGAANCESAAISACSVHLPSLLASPSWRAIEAQISLVSCWRAWTAASTSTAVSSTSR